MKEADSMMNQDVSNLNTFNKIFNFFKKNGKKSAVFLFLFFLLKGILWLVGAGVVLNFLNFF